MTTVRQFDTIRSYIDKNDMVNEAARALGKLAAKKNFEGLTKEEIKKKMSDVRRSGKNYKNSCKEKA